MTQPKNHERHFYLYAKYHYQINDVIEDLKKIQADRCNINVELISVYDVAHILLELVGEHIGYEDSDLDKFMTFVLDLSPEQHWVYIPARSVSEITQKKDTDSFYIALIHKCLSILRYTEIKDLNLGIADPRILPLKTNQEKKENSK